VSPRLAGIGQDDSVVNGFWRRLREPVEREPNATCPVCGEPVIAEPEATFLAGGPMMAKRTKEELIAACRTHGRPPFNNSTRHYVERHP
jgi:hypothetical protein